MNYVLLRNCNDRKAHRIMKILNIKYYSTMKRICKWKLHSLDGAIFMRSGACFVSFVMRIEFFLIFYPFLIEMSATGWNNVGNNFQPICFNPTAFLCAACLSVLWSKSNGAKQARLVYLEFELMCNLIVINLLLCSFICNFVVDFYSEY